MKSYGIKNELSYELLEDFPQYRELYLSAHFYMRSILDILIKCEECIYYIYIDGE